MTLGDQLKLPAFHGINKLISKNSLSKKFSKLPHLTVRNKFKIKERGLYYNTKIEPTFDKLMPNSLQYFCCCCCAFTSCQLMIE